MRIVGGESYLENPDESMPSQIGSYRFVRLLGKGSMGAVYEVVHEHLGVHLALKLFRTGGRNADFLRI